MICSTGKDNFNDIRTPSPEGINTNISIYPCINMNIDINISVNKDISTSIGIIIPHHQHSR